MLSKINPVIQTPFSWKMSSRCKTVCCRSLSSNQVRATGYHIVHTAALPARFPTSALSAHDRTQTNEPRSERRFAHALCMASRARRSYSHVRERKSLRTSRPKFFRAETFIVYMNTTPFQHHARRLATTHAQIPVYILEVKHVPGICRYRPMMIFLYPVLLQS